MRAGFTGTSDKMASNKNVGESSRDPRLTSASTLDYGKDIKNSSKVPTPPMKDRLREGKKKELEEFLKQSRNVKTHSSATPTQLSVARDGGSPPHSTPPRDLDSSVNLGKTNKTVNDHGKNMKRNLTTESDDEEGFWQLKLSKKAKKRAGNDSIQEGNQGSHTQTNKEKPAHPASLGKETNVPAVPFPKFQIRGNEAYPTAYAAVQAIEKRHPGIQFRVRPDIKGNILLHPLDTVTVSKLEDEMKNAVFSLLKLDPAMKVTKSVVLRYPTEFSLEPLQNHPKILKAERCVPRADKAAVTRQVLITHYGPSPQTIDLKIWGKYNVRAYVPEPMRCFKCQRYGHRMERCTASYRCAICSLQHDTAVCMEKKKKGEVVKAKCHNCGGAHPTFHYKCPKRVERVNVARPVAKPQPAVQKPVYQPAPPGTFKWGSQAQIRQRQQQPLITAAQQQLPDLRNTEDFPNIAVTVHKSPAIARTVSVLATQQPAAAVCNGARPKVQVQKMQAPPKPKPRRAPRPARRQVERKEEKEQETEPEVIPVKELKNVLSNFAQGLAALLGQKIQEDQLSNLMGSLFTAASSTTEKKEATEEKTNIQPPLPVARCNSNVEKSSEKPQKTQINTKKAPRRPAVCTSTPIKDVPGSSHTSLDSTIMEVNINTILESDLESTNELDVSVGTQLPGLV